MRGFFMDKKVETLMESYKFENYPRRDQSKGVRCPPISSKSAYIKLELHTLPRLQEKLAFSGKVYEDANKHVCYALEIAHSIYIPDITKDALMLWCFPKTLVGDARRWLDGLPSNSINTWEKLEEKFVQQYDPPYQAWKPTTGDPIDEAQKRGLEVSAELAEESSKRIKIMCVAIEQLEEEIRNSEREEEKKIIGEMKLEAIKNLEQLLGYISEEEEEEEEEYTIFLDTEEPTRRTPEPRDASYTEEEL